MLSTKLKLLNTKPEIQNVKINDFVAYIQGLFLSEQISANYKYTYSNKS